MDRRLRKVAASSSGTLLHCSGALCHPPYGKTRPRLARAAAGPSASSNLLSYD